MPSNEIIANVVLRDLDLNYQGQTFQVAILTRNCLKMQSSLLPSDRNSGICRRMAPLRMLYTKIFNYILKFTNFETWLSQKSVRAGDKCSIVTLVDVAIYHGIRPLRMLYSITLTFIFKNKYLVVMHLL